MHTAHTLLMRSDCAVVMVIVPIVTSLQPNSELRLGDTGHALPVMNCLASRAHDYSKKSAVLRITTCDWRVILLQTT